MRLSYKSLRSLARHNRTMRRCGYAVPSVSEGEGWTTNYDVVIGGRRFTLWCKHVSSSASAYAITLDGRIRFVDRSSIFATALAAWEAITGIRYLGIYRNGSPVYGHSERVELVEKAGPQAPFLNYTRRIIKTSRVPAVSVGCRDVFLVAD